MEEGGEPEGAGNSSADSFYLESRRMGCLIRQYIERWRDIVLEDQQLSEIESTESVLKYFALADPTAILSYYDP